MTHIDYYNDIRRMLERHPEGLTTHEITIRLFPSAEGTRLTQKKGAISGRLKTYVRTGYFQRIQISRRNDELKQRKEWLYYLEDSE